MSKKGKDYTTEKRVVYKTVKKKKVRIKIIPVLFTLLILYLLGYGIYKYMNKPITNIYVSGNSLYSDWDIITRAKLDDYPSSSSFTTSDIKKLLEEDKLIYKAKVKRRRFTIIEIEVEENIPLLYDETSEKTVLKDGSMVDEKYDVPVLLNEMPEKIYKNFLEELSNLPYSVFVKISEIKYDPDDVDKERILLSMNDGIYVYITMLKFNALYDYNDIVVTLNNKKGILYLNSGGYFKVMK